MGFLKNMVREGLSDGISKGISKGIGNAVGNAVNKAVAPAAEKYANKTAGYLNEAANNMEQTTNAAAQSANAAQTTRTATGGFAGLEGALANWQQAAESYATELSKNVKICPACGEGTTADKKFCPQCGAKLPEQTVAQGAVCPSCGKQNTVGTKFCADCGAKLPAAAAEEQAAADQNAAALARWDTVLAGFPKWACGGSHYRIQTEGVATEFCATFATGAAAQNAVEQYKGILKQNGFREAGQYPDRDHLYKKVGGVCYHVDTEHCFEGDSETPSIYFMHDEPTGGFDYVKPQKPAQSGLFGLFK